MQCLCALSAAGLLVQALHLGGVPSGPQVGEALTPFKVHAYSGDDAGKEVEAVKRLKKGPALVLFVHKLTRPAFRCIKPIDAYVAEKDKLAGQIVWLSKDKDATLAFLKRAQNSLNLQTPVGVSLDGETGPEKYGLNDMVTLTVLVVNDGKVVANFPLVDPNESDAPKVIAALKKIVQ